MAAKRKRTPAKKKAKKTVKKRAKEIKKKRAPARKPRKPVTKKRKVAKRVKAKKSKRKSTPKRGTTQARLRQLEKMLANMVKQLKARDKEVKAARKHAKDIEDKFKRAFGDLQKQRAKEIKEGTQDFRQYIKEHIGQFHASAIDFGKELLEEITLLQGMGMAPEAFAHDLSERFGVGISQIYTLVLSPGHDWAAG